jgi:carbamoyltransferase
MQEERLNRIKRAAVFPMIRSAAVQYCLDAANISLADVDLVVDCTIARAPRDMNASLHRMLGADAKCPEILRVPHHLGHAASAFCTSGFKESTVMVIDGGGSFGWQLTDVERAASLSFSEQRVEHLSLYCADHRGIVPVEKHLSEMPYLAHLWKKGQGMLEFASLGHMFASAALQIFGDYLDAGKVMGLAPLGKAVFAAEDFVNYRGGELRFSDAVPKLFRHSERWPRHEQAYCDLAASVQQALENVLESYLAAVSRDLPRSLCYAGGVALNSVANHKVVCRAGFEDVYVIPAAEDSGTSIGAAYYGLMQLRGKPASRRLTSDSLGRRYSEEEVDTAIASLPALRTVVTDDPIGSTVDLLCDGKILGWFQGGAEFGPRSLGYRSIICDPRLSDGKDILNSRVKHREAFRPFAPAILEEHAASWFELSGSNRLTQFMLDVATFRDPLPGPNVPAVVHVDGTGRLQTVTADGNRRFWELLNAFYARTGVPIIVNTSMNIMGEPIVESPRDALWLLLFTGVDYCVVENRVVGKDPSFESVLNFAPIRTHSGEQANASREALEMLFPKGSSVHIEGAVQILKASDGGRSFRDLLRDSDIEGQEARQLELVGHLFRRSLIDFVS